MSVLSIAELKNRFQTTDQPSARDFADLIDTLATGLIVSGVQPTGAAGGSLSGTYPNPGIAADAVGATQVDDYSLPITKLTGTGGTLNQVPAVDGSGHLTYQSVDSLVTPAGGGSVGSVAFNTATSDLIEIPADGDAITPWEHGLGGVPTGFQAFLVCNSADMGYAEDATIPIESVVDITTAATMAPAFAIYTSVTGDIPTISILRCGATLSTLSVTTEASGTLTASKWDILITAYRAGSVGAAAVQYELANPCGGITATVGGVPMMLVAQADRSSGSGLMKIDLTTNQVLRVGTRFSPAGSGFNFSIVPIVGAPARNLIYVTIASMDSHPVIYTVNLADMTTVESLTVHGSSSLLASVCQVIMILEAPGAAGEQTGSAGATTAHPDLYLPGKTTAESTDSLGLNKLIWDAGDGRYEVEALPTGVEGLNLRTGVPALATFIPGSARVLLFQANPVDQGGTIGKRIYLMTEQTGLLHVLKLGASCSNVADLWVHQLAHPVLADDYLIYVKTIALAGTPGSPWVDTANERYAVEIDPTTGQEIAIVASRRGNTSKTGSVCRIPWTE